jgi:hypothetical protein
MNNLEEAVIRYEKARQLKNKLKKERSLLFAKCSGVDADSDFYTCINVAFELLKDDALVDPQGNWPSLEETFYHFINDDKGACESCIKAWEIKKGPLAKASKDFGAAKLSITAHAKNLMKGDK